MSEHLYLAKMKTIKKWKTSVTLKFLREYERQSCLWDSNSADYKKKYLRMQALKEIEKKMKIPGFTVVDVSRKVHALRATYLNEIKKTLASQKSGENQVYKPKLPWFPTAHRFLQKVVILNGNQFQINQMANENDSSGSFSPTTDHSYYTKTNNKFPKDALKIENDSENNECLDSEPIRSRKNGENKDIVLLHRAIENLRQLTFLTRVNPSGKKHDEFDVFASSVAVQLRNLPLSIAYDIQLQIANIFTHAKKESLVEQQRSRKVKTPRYLNTVMKPEY